MGRNISRHLPRLVIVYEARDRIIHVDCPMSFLHRSEILKHHFLQLVIVVGARDRESSTSIVQCHVYIGVRSLNKFLCG